MMNNSPIPIRVLFFFFAFNIVCFCVFAQSPDQVLGMINIASPNASSLGKFGEFPVSYHTGTPRIEIPLYTIKEGGLSVPISLSYNSSGIKVEEQSSNVGLGWALTAGGVITRSVMDKPDERMTSSLNQQYGHFSDYGLAGRWFKSGGSQLGPIAFDNEPDLFFFNFAGYNGKFYFNDDRTPMLIPEQDLKIEYVYPADTVKQNTWTTTPGMWYSGYPITSFKITVPDGTRYYFGAAFPTNSPNCDPLETINTMSWFQDSATGNGSFGTGYNTTVSSWFLQRIVSMDGNFTINFYYSRDKFATYSVSSPQGGQGYLPIKNFIAGVFLDSIKGPNTLVRFNKGIIRKDLSSWNTGADAAYILDNPNATSYSLGGLNVTNKNGTCLKSFLFSQDYFVDTTTPLLASFNNYVSYDVNKLRLNLIQEQTCDGTLQIPPYVFQYFGEAVPRSMSLARDHWGYNNGASGNASLYLPTTPYRSGNSPGGATGNRKPSWPAMRAGTLNRITFPTGGFTQFDFEPHLFTITQTNNNVTTTADSIVGGLRIKTISSYDPLSRDTVITNYAYTNDGSSLSSGVLYSVPTYILIARNDFYAKTWPVGGFGYAGCLSANNNLLGNDYVFSDHSIRPMATTQGNHIGYGTVRVSQKNNGYSIFRFSVTPPWQVVRNTLAITSVANTSCDTSIPNYPPAPLPIDLMRGEMTYEGHFDNTGRVITEKNFSPVYSLDPVTTPGRKWCTTALPTPMETWYELQTGYKSQMTVTENYYQADGTVETQQTITNYASPNHHQPSETITTGSDGSTVDTKMTYAFDYLVPIFKNTSNCLYSSSSFVRYTNQAYGEYGFQNQFLNGSGDFSGPWQTALSAYTDSVFFARYRYVKCRVANFTGYSPLNTYQVNHNTAKAGADQELGPLLWAQDIFYNPMVEETQWVGGKLARANYTQFSNLRQDAYGVYPYKTMSIDIANNTTSVFTPSSTSASGASVSKDPNYTNVTLATFMQGQPINLLPRNGISTAYDWGYGGSLPTVQATNAVNQIAEVRQQVLVTQPYNFQLVNGTPFAGSAIINHQGGTITLSMSQGSAFPPGAQASATIVINGTPYSLCSAASGATCGGTPSSLSFNLSAGQYTLNYSVSTTFSSYSFACSFTFSYQGLVITPTGVKEYFYDGFEENASASVISGTSHTGRKYWNANYVAGFAPPNARIYQIQWWNLANGQWHFNQQSYTNGMTLPGPVDDVRIFPIDAQINTYTHEPGVGMTSKMDANGVVNYYYYDKLGRLSYITDQNAKIIKQYQYNYTH